MHLQPYVYLCHVCLFIMTFYILLTKIFIFVVNAADNKQRDKNMTCIKVSIDP